MMSKKIWNTFTSVMLTMSLLCIATAHADNPKILSSGPILEITQQPTLTAAKLNTRSSVFFIIHNKGSFPVPLNSPTITYSPSNQLINPILTNNCSHLIPANGQCVYTFAFSAGSIPSSTNVDISFNYDRRQIPLVAATFNIVANTLGETLTVSPQPESTTAQFNETGTVTFGIQNNASMPVPLDPTTITIVSAGVISNTSLSSPCGTTIPSNQNCTFTFGFTAGNTTANTDVNITFNYNGNTNQLPVDTFNISVNNTVPPTSNTRTITFTNLCNQTLWFGITGGAVRSVNPPAGCTGAACTQCASDADCFPGSHCATHCYSDTPTPNAGDYSLAHNETKTVSIPIPDNSLDIGTQNIFWSGAMGARTGCAFNGSNIFVCDTGTCDNISTPGQQACTTGVGMTPPNTLAEITMLRNNVDSYDISIINGVNVPVSFGPTTTPRDASNPFICGTAGSTQTVPSSQGNLEGCNWTLTPPSIKYLFVSNGPTSCSSNSDCSSPQICGLSLETVTDVNNLSSTTCGNFLGWWTADQICGLNPNMGIPFNCNLNMSNMIPNITLTQLLQCAPPIPSCYDTNQPQQNDICCGCANWGNVGLGITLPDPPIVAACYNTSQDWVSSVQPNLSWLKTACPTAYVYPYDDASSSFTCNTPDTDDSPAINLTDYTVTFCPS